MIESTSGLLGLGLALSGQVYGPAGAYCAFVSDPDGNSIEAVHKEIQ